MNNEIIYRLTDKAVAYRVTSYSVCFEAHDRIDIIIENADRYDNLILTARVGLKILNINKNEAGVFVIPASVFLPNSTLLLDLSALDNTDRLIKSWMLEPLKFVTLEQKQNEIMTSLQDYAFLKNRIKALEHESYTANKNIDELKNRISELERMLATLTEVML